MNEIEEKRHRVILGQRMNRFVYVDLLRPNDADGFLSPPTEKGHILLGLFLSFPYSYLSFNFDCLS